MTHVEDQKIDARFPDLGLKIRGRILAGIGMECPRRSEDRWWDREACVETKQNREVVGSIRCFKKKLDKIAAAWLCISFAAWLCISFNSIGVLIDNWDRDLAKKKNDRALVSLLTEPPFFCSPVAPFFTPQISFFFPLSFFS